MGASSFHYYIKPLNKPHFSVGSWGLLMNLVGRRINKKGLYIKAYRMFLDVLGIQYGGAAAI
ncbi:hypothetical protein TUM19329_02840 [Legionella antarctica]|uniref:Uncharacterized protein n=1 Tax=Legionella antarctica TaxID=2708020 RepID=A0A6F8T121_9GAMM|nr:hypothetical protein TUM19329_02840 [Legionella antarctica]